MKGIRVTEIAKEIRFKGVWWRVRSKRGFPETTYHKIFETSSSFHVEWPAHCGKSLAPAFQEFFVGINGIFNLAGGLGAGLSLYGV